MKFSSPWGHGAHLNWRALAGRLPSQCAVCRGWGGQRVCGACTARFSAPGPRCAQCAARVPDGVSRCGGCLVEPPRFDSACAAVDYAFPWDDLVLKLKFRSGLDLLPALVDRMLQAHRCAPPPVQADLVLPVPLSLQRLRERGFNQAWELARRLAPRTTGRADATLLLRLRDTPHQLSLPKDQRAAAVRGAFAVDPLRRAEVAGRHVALVDDVATTLATADEIAGVLKQAGARHVHLWCLARTPAAGGAS